VQLVHLIEIKPFKGALKKPKKTPCYHVIEHNNGKNKWLNIIFN